MTRYVGDRVLQGVVTLFVLSLIVFVLGRISGDPLNLLLPLGATPADFEHVRASLGLDQPWPVQYVEFVKHAAVLDLGTSLTSRRPVIELILQRLPSSVTLAAAAMVFATVLAIPLGIVASVRRGSKLDTAITSFAVINLSIPSFFFAIVLISVFSGWLRILPAAGSGGPEHYILPVAAMTGGVFAGTVRLLRSSMLEVLGSEFVKFARIKGLPERTVMWKHALRNALIPVVTFGALYFTILLTSAVVVETVFAWPGVGRLAYEAVRVRDFPVIQGVVLVFGTIVVAVNLGVDILYAVLDPRVRRQRSS